MITNEAIKANLRETFKLGNTTIIASIINRRLGEVDLKSEEQNMQEIKDGIIKWLKARFPELSDEEILNLVEQKGGFSALVGPYLVTEVKKEEKLQQIREEEAKQRAVEDDRLIEQKQVEREEQEQVLGDITYDPELNQKLAKLVSDMKNARSQAQGKFVGIPKEFFRDIPDDKLSQVVQYLESELGFEFKSRTHGVVEQEGRSVEEETVTKDDLLKGDVKAVIPTEKLQSKEFEMLLEDKDKDLSGKAKKAEVARESVGEIEVNNDGRE